MGLISDRKAKSIRPGDKPIASGITGLRLHATNTPGRGKWILRFTSPTTGKRRDMGLGTYPDTTVKSALETARTARIQIAAGIDPIDARKSDRAVPTFAEVANTHWQKIAPTFRNPKHSKQWISSLENHVFSAIGDRRIDTLDTADFAKVINSIITNTPETGKRIKSRCHQIMAAARASGLIQSNPMTDIDLLLIKPSLPPDRHHPAMLWRDIPAFIEQHLSKPYSSHQALLFCILTAARSGEVRGATWDEIDVNAKLWTVSAERMKAHRQHVVPLSSQALDVIKAQHALRMNELVFSAPRGGVLSDMTLTGLLRRAKAPSDTPGRTATAHGFRSSFSNWAADHGINSDVVERALAHTITNKVRAAYERTDRLQARIQLMQDWADYCLSFKINSPFLT